MSHTTKSIVHDGRVHVAIPWPSEAGSILRAIQVCSCPMPLRGATRYGRVSSLRTEVAHELILFTSITTADALSVEVPVLGAVLQLLATISSPECCEHLAMVVMHPIPRSLSARCSSVCVYHLSCLTRPDRRVRTESCCSVLRIGFSG